MKATHSELPWQIEKDEGRLYIVNGVGTMARIGACGDCDDEDERNAELIIRAINSHDALMIALTEIESLLDCGNIEQSHWDDALGIARTALKKAKDPQ